MIRKIVVYFLLCLCIPYPIIATANDTVGAVEAGGIEFKKTDEISMEKEVLTISSNLVRVEYEFLNKTTHPTLGRIGAATTGLYQRSM